MTKFASPFSRLSSCTLLAWCAALLAVATPASVFAAATPAAAPASAATPAAPTSFKFQFGADKAAPGYTLISPTTIYSKDTGFGLEPGAQVTAVTQTATDPLQTGAVTGTAPFAFAVKVPEGNYRVTVTLGDPKAEAMTTVKAEARRLMLERVNTPAGKFVTKTFTVNVRRPTLSDGRTPKLDSREMNLDTNEAITPTWDDKLTITFSDTHPAVAAIDIKKVDDAITVFVVGDSTVTDQPGGNGSWGQMFPRWFKSEVAVANHAESGETLRGSLNELRWAKVLDTMKPGDYVFIQFGTNDSKNSGPQNIYPNQTFAETYAPADGLYKELLKQYVADAQKRGGHPVIVSPPARRGEMPGGRISLGAYETAAMAAAKEAGVPGIDLNAMGQEMNAALGADAVRIYADGTHTQDYGAYMFSRAVALGIKQDNLDLAKYLADDTLPFDPKAPTPKPDDFKVPSGAAGGRGAGGGGRRGGAAAAAGGAAAPQAAAPAAAQ